MSARRRKGPNLCWALACLLALLLPAALQGQEPGRRPFALLGPDQGLPSGSVICISQDRVGFLWLGTENGLIRYEGGGYRRWTTADGLPSNWIARLIPAPDGSLWVGTLKGLVRLREGKLERALLDGRPAQGPVSHLALDNRGRLWVGSSEGLFAQAGDLDFSRQAWSPAGRIHGLHAGRSGTLYLAGEQGLHALSPEGKLHQWGPKEGLPTGGPMLVAEDAEGRVWAGAGRLLALKRPGETTFTDQSRRLGVSLSPNGAPLVDGDGSVWFPTQEGALRLGEGAFELLGLREGLPFRWVRSLFRDREGTLWVVGPALARLQGGGRIRNYALSQGSSGEVVWFISRDRSGLLLATDDGAARLGPQGLEALPGTRGRRIKSLARDRSGTLWMVSTLGPTLWLKPGQQQAQVAPLGELGSAVNSVLEDTQGRIWLGHTRHGLLGWDPRRRQLYREVPPDFAQVQNLGVYGLREDSSGRLWAGSSAGLLVRQPDGRWLRFSEQEGLKAQIVRGLDFLQDGSAWIHYQEPCGLTLLRLEGDRLRVLQHRQQGQGLRSNAVYAVAVDGQNRVWASTDQGLDRPDPYLHVGRHEGMTSEDCAVHALLAEGGNVWVGTAGGLVRYDSRGTEFALPAPSVHVLEMGTRNRSFEGPIGALPPLPFAEASLRFRIAAPTYCNERELRFQVRLLGLETGWRDIDGHTIHFPALPGGRYHFEARASVGDGPFGPPARISFTVTPPWWRRGWVTGLGILAILGLIWGFVRLRLAALARSKALLEELVSRRTAELRERNEALSEALANVKQLSGLLPICAHCKKIRDDRGYWNHLEEYISTHSEADFSHGICPGCLEVHYPQFIARKLPD